MLSILAARTIGFPMSVDVVGAVGADGVTARARRPWQFAGKTKQQYSHTTLVNGPTGVPPVNQQRCT